MTLIAGRYQPLDAARSSTPLRARDLQTAQTVLLREVQVPSERAVQAAAAARAAQRIFHPSLITLFDVVSASEHSLLLAYEFVPAQTLLQLSGGSPLAVRRATEVVAEIADGVAELHARGIAHGAISQISVLMTMKGKAKLDRVGDPSLIPSGNPGAADDLAALGALLHSLTRHTGSGGVVGAQAVEALAERACAGRFDSAATLAAMLRRVGR